MLLLSGTGCYGPRFRSSRFRGRQCSMVRMKLNSQRKSYVTAVYYLNTKQLSRVALGFHQMTPASDTRVYDTQSVKLSSATLKADSDEPDLFSIPPEYRDEFKSLFTKKAAVKLTPYCTHVQATLL